MFDTSIVCAQVSCVLAAFCSAISDNPSTAWTIRFLESSNWTVVDSICSIFLSEVPIPSITSATIFSVSTILQLWLLIISCTLLMISTASSEFFINVFVISSILRLDSFDCSASFWIWAATTANPRPLSPALAASILAFKLRRFVSSAIEVIISVAAWIFCADSFVKFVCLVIVSIDFSTSSFICLNCCMVDVACSLDFRITSAFWLSKSTSREVVPICSPISIIFSVVLFVLFACSEILFVIELTAFSTCFIVELVSFAVIPSSFAANRRFSVLCAIFLIMFWSVFCNVPIAFARSPISSFLPKSFSSIGFPSSPSATFCTAPIPFFSDFVIDIEIMTAMAIQTAITEMTENTTVQMMPFIVASFTFLFVPTNIIPIGFESVPLW